MTVAEATAPDLDRGLELSHGVIRLALIGQDIAEVCSRVRRVQTVGAGSLRPFHECPAERFLGLAIVAQGLVDGRRRVVCQCFCPGVALGESSGDRTVVRCLEGALLVPTMTMRWAAAVCIASSRCSSDASSSARTSVASASS